MASNDVIAKMAVKISSDTAEFSKGLKQANSQFTSFSKSITDVGKAIGISLGATAIFNGLKYGVGIMADFEKRMSEVRAITGATGQDFEDLKNNALDLGRATLYSAEQVAQLQVAYGRLGFSTKEILSATKATIDLATATGEDLAKAADTVGSTIRAFGLSASDTTKVTDIMASSFNKTALGLENFTEAIKYVAPIAAQAGISLEETTAMLGTLADAGIRGSSAGTSLRKIITDLGGESGTLAEKLKKLADKGLTGAQALDEVGRTAYASLLILSKATEKTEGLTEAFRHAEGETAKMAAVMSDNLSGDVTKLTNAWDGLIISLGNTSVFRNAAQGLEGLIKAVQGLPNERLLFEGLAASVKTGFNLDKAIANVAAYREEVGKPINIGQFETIIKKYNLTEKQVYALNAALETVNKSISRQESTIAKFKEFAEKNGYKDLTEAAKEYIAQIDKLIVKETNLEQANKQFKIETGSKGFDESIAKSQRLIAIYRQMIEFVKQFNEESAKKPVTAPTQEKTPLPGLIESIQNQIKAFEEAQKKAFSPHDVEVYAISISDLQDKLKRLTKTLDEPIIKAQKLSDVVEAFKYNNKTDFDSNILNRQLDFDADNLQKKFKLSEEVVKNFKSAYQAMAADVEAANKQIGASIKKVTFDIGGLVAGGLSSIAQALGQAAVGVGNLGQSLLKAIGSFAQQFGEILILSGIGTLELQSGSAEGMIAGGLLLVAAGAALSALATERQSIGASGGGFPGSSTTSGSNSSTNFNPGSAKERIELGGTVEIAGDKLLILLRTASEKDKGRRG